MAVHAVELEASTQVPPGQQIDLFVESLVSAPLRDDRATMEFPFFALQKRPLLTPIIYQDGNVSIRISPGERESWRCSTAKEASDSNRNRTNRP